MKNLGYIAAIALLNTAFAADLDIQKGQWSAEIDEINFNFGTGGSKKTYSDVDGDFSKDGRFGGGIQIVGRYGVSNITVLRLKTGLSGYRYYEQAPNSDELEWTISTSSYELSPSVELKLSKNWSSLTGFGLSGKNNSENDSEFSMQVFGGALYNHDLSDKLLLTSETAVVWDLDKDAPTGWENEVTDTTYFRFYNVTQGKFFLANNFSVNLGVAFSKGARLGKSVDGDDVTGDTKWSYQNIGTTFGFTYYHR